MKTIIFFFLAALIITSCVPKPATKEQKTAALQNSTFDKINIKKLPQYEELKNFLELNADTIISYRDTKNEVTLVRGQGLPDSTYLQKEDCYNFFQGNERFNITNVPDFLKEPLYKIFHSIGDSNIASFTVCKDKIINIEISSNGVGNRLFISHNFIWNSKSGKDYKYENNKDSLLNDNCIYRIGLIEDEGF